MMRPRLFEPLRLRGLTIKNRAWLAPMCQYSATGLDGHPTDWHMAHLGARAVGGFGLLLTESTAVVPEGRITAYDTGMWSDCHIETWMRISRFVHEQDAHIGVQLGHAGRKGSVSSPLTGRSHPVHSVDGGWEVVGPSDDPYPGLHVPHALTSEELSVLPRAFADAAARAAAAGFDVVEVHAGHGYLLGQFLSPLINDRTDDYGGTFDGRVRLLLEVVDAVREVWPERSPVFVRVSATEWAPGGWDVNATVELSSELSARGVDLVDLSSGGSVAHQQIDPFPGYQVPFSRAVKQQTGLSAAAVGLITEPRQAEQILVDGAADAILLGREALRNPFWPVTAAHELLGEMPLPAQYARAWLAATQ